MDSEAVAWAPPTSRRVPADALAIRHPAIERLTTIYTTPGFTDERIHLFLAHGLEAGAHRREADEFMELHTLRWSEIMAKVRSGEVQDAKTLTTLLFVQCFRRTP